MSELKVEVKDWSYTCGDGCCYTYGTEIYINDKLVSRGDYNSIEIILKDVLENLGHKVEIT